MTTQHGRRRAAGNDVPPLDADPTKDDRDARYGQPSALNGASHPREAALVGS